MKKISIKKLLSYEFSRYQALLHEYAMENLEFEESSEEHEGCDGDDCCDEDEDYEDDEDEGEESHKEQESEEELDIPSVSLEEYAFSFSALRIAAGFHYMFEKIFREKISSSSSYDFEGITDWLMKNDFLMEKDLDNLGILLTFVYETLDIEQQESEYICFTDNEEKILLLSVDQLIDVLQTANDLFKKLESKQII